VPGQAKKGDEPIDIIRAVAGQAQQARGFGRTSAVIQFRARRTIQVIDADGGQIVLIGLEASFVQVSTQRQHGVAQALAPQAFRGHIGAHRRQQLQAEDGYQRLAGQDDDEGPDDPERAQRRGR